MIISGQNLKNKVFILFKFIGLKKIFFLSIFIILGSFFEVIGIGLIGPFISMLLDDTIISSNVYLSKIYSNVPTLIQQNFITFFGLTLILTFLIVNLFLAILFYSIEKVARESTADLSVNLLKNYFKKEYIFFTKTNSSDLVKNIVIETQQVVHGIVLPILQTIGRFFIIISIFLLLISINFELTFWIILFFFILFFFIFNFVKNKLRKIGIQRSYYDKLRFIISNETINSIKEAKKLKLENFFINKFISVCYKYAKIHVKVVVYTIFPKYFIEFIVLTLIVTILLIFNQNSAFLENLPLLSVFIFAGYRILPGAQLIYASLSSIKKSEESLNIIFRDLLINLETKDQNKKKEINFVFEKNIKFNDVSYSYENNSKKIINKLNLQINKNDKIALIGKTGSGKSTFIDLITGLLNPTSGEIMIDDKKILSKYIDIWQKNINYLPQKMFFLDKTLEENIAIGAEERTLIDSNKITKACEFAELNLEDANISIKKNVGESGDKLSGGEKQRVGIARLFYNMREILIFDESTNAIDAKTESKIFEKLMKLNKTVFFVTHNLTHLRYFKKIIFFSDKEIQIGNLDELKNKNIDFKLLVEMNDNLK